jgi:signal recognition particle receptor subunit beta
LWFNKISSLSNAPVVGVSWYEAMAFCRWVSRFLNEDGWEIDLPYEAEWEHAARYPDGRKYPWGNTYFQGFANIDESSEGAIIGPFSIGKPTAVGIYNKGYSALRIADLCGNVWEWCKNRWDIQYKWPEITESNEVDHRVIKGGAWYNSIRFASLGVHDCLDADLGVNDIGLRVVKRKINAKYQCLRTELTFDNDNAVRKILILGTSGSGRTDFVRNTSDFPLVDIHKRDFASDDKIRMDYGRHFYRKYKHMYYLYAPLDTDITNLYRFIGEMQAVIFMIDGCAEYLDIDTECLMSMSRQCKSRNIPFIIGISGYDSTDYINERSIIDELRSSGITAVPFSAIKREGCTSLIDELFMYKKESEA